ncbi:MAG: pilus biosynthesis protein TadE [Nitrospirales bacterium]|nr:MAG: pilus biosynthesis protein TadE [Nitrospirales bacterium]
MFFMKNNVSVKHARRGTGVNERGSVFVEFSLIAVSLSLLIALVVDVARMVFVSQLLQETVRVAARELSLFPLSPVMTFEQALQYPQVKSRIYDSAALVIEIDHFTDSYRLEKFLDGLPIVNRMLRPLMNVEHIMLDGSTRKVLRFPGILVQDRTGQSDLNSWSVNVPYGGLTGGANGEHLNWKPVLEEVRGNPEDPNSGSFSLQPSQQGALAGLVALRINYPFQPMFMNWLPQSVLPDSVTISSAGNSSFSSDPPEARERQVGEPSFTHTPNRDSSRLNIHGTLKEYPHVLSAQAVFRREVFQ